ncbi:MAG: hypothetical protein VX154_06945 [Pseudomonadota bacterium]|nr:hypothetical protein [Pseudomonadota bacterium]
MTIQISLTKKTLMWYLGLTFLSIVFSFVFIDWLVAVVKVLVFWSLAPLFLFVAAFQGGEMKEVSPEGHTSQ